MSEHNSLNLHTTLGMNSFLSNYISYQLFTCYLPNHNKSQPFSFHFVVSFFLFALLQPCLYLFNHASISSHFYIFFLHSQTHVHSSIFTCSFFYFHMFILLFSHFHIFYLFSQLSERDITNNTRSGTVGSIITGKAAVHGNYDNTSLSKNTSLKSHSNH